MGNLQSEKTQSIEQSYDREVWDRIREVTASKAEAVEKAARAERKLKVVEEKLQIFQEAAQNSPWQTVDSVWKYVNVVLPSAEASRSRADFFQQTTPSPSRTKIQGSSKIKQSRQSEPGKDAADEFLEKFENEYLMSGKTDCDVSFKEVTERRPYSRSKRSRRKHLEQVHRRKDTRRSSARAWPTVQ